MLKFESLLTHGRSLDDVARYVLPQRFSIPNLQGIVLEAVVDVFLCCHCSDAYGVLCLGKRP